MFSYRELLITRTSSFRSRWELEKAGMSEDIIATESEVELETLLGSKSSDVAVLHESATFKTNLHEKPLDGSTVQGLDKICLYMRVFCVYVASVLASGILPVWPVVQSRFKAAGVFLSACEDREPCDAQDLMLSDIYLLGTTLLLSASWPIGIIFDTLGARTTTLIGCAGCCAGSLCMATVVSQPTMSWLLYPGVILTDIGSSMNSFGLYGFLWHFRSDQGFLSGLASSTYAVSSLFPLALLSCFAFSRTLWLIAGFSFGALLLCAVAVPTSAEYCEEAERVTGQKIEAPSFSFGATARACLRIFKAHFMANLLFCFSLLAMICNYQYYTAALSPFLTSLLHSEKDAMQVAMLGANLYGVLGFFLSPVVGRLCDACGLHKLVYSMTFLSVSLVPLSFAPSLTLQEAASFVGTALGLLQTVYYYRWFALYSPPEHFGNYSGCICTCCGVLSLLVQALLQTISQSFFSGLLLYVVPLGFLGGASIVSSLAFCWYYSGVSIPEVPPHLDEGSE
eukprot:TRINITY_DN64492_c0_g1_i1.p1 TRINITY_DN64492_c0_g1~~TRINITY_DN64492_c0_g1_i1.p1  ORF type:complete len:510 (+),score=67.31 TRINITY_DN64492_c0_g1_i1:118-1647(+)